MAGLVEEIATRLGEPLTTSSGQRRYGKHSWRATGARYLASLQLEVYKIQLLARWLSPIVLHYVRLAHWWVSRKR